MYAFMQFLIKGITIIPVRWMRVDPRRAAELGILYKCVVFSAGSSRSALVVHLDELRKLFTVEEGPVGYKLQSRWGVYFLERCKT